MLLSALTYAHSPTPLNFLIFPSLDHTSQSHIIHIIHAYNTRHRYWYPLYHFLSLAMTPTMMIGLNKDFNMPLDFQVTCNAPPSMFAYPAKEEMKKDDKKLVATAGKIGF